MLGLRRGTVALVAHEEEWEREAQRTIAKLQEILGGVAYDIQHVGSTSVPSIKAKPIVDIAVAVRDFTEVLTHEDRLRAHGFYYRPKVHLGEQLLFACGSYYDGSGEVQTHFIHVVKADSEDWQNYVNFRDYLNSHPAAAKEYEALKLHLAELAPIDAGREKYTAGKYEFITEILRKAREEK